MKPTNMKSKTCGLAMATLIGFAASAQAAAIIPTTTDTTSRSGWTILTFTAGSGEWTVPIGVTTVDVLVVGGGGGGMGGGGGGAGGGFYGATGLGVTPGTEINVTVGAGGAAAKRPADTGTYPNGGAAETGGQSEFGSLIAFGGQGGAFIWTSSGWGAAYGGTSGTNNQNAIGGIVADGGDYGSGSGVGVKGIVGEGAAGGAGLSSMITGGTTWYGGGGGEMRNGAGGLGGGGAGSSVLSWNGSSGNAGTANTGGGGGAGYGSDVPGGNGGSGVVIVVYQVTTNDPYLNWVASIDGFTTDTGPTLDPDGDGISNFQEFAFGLNPTLGTSVNPITNTSALKSGQFSYTRFATSGLTYTIWTSVNLIDWDKAEASVQQPGEPDESTGVQTVLVDVNPMPDGNNVFVRVKAEQAP